jgi:hypothetical protein
LICIAILEYRCTPIPGLEVSPAEILMNRLLRSRLPISNSNLKPKISENIKEKLVNKQIKYKKYYDNSAKRREVHFNKNDDILINKEQ